MDLDLDDTLIICDFADKNLRIKFNNNQYLTNSLQQNNFEFSVFKNGLKQKTLVI